MGNYINSADLNIQSGLLIGRMHFNPGINILSGENGTLKTKTLQALKMGTVNLHDPKSPCRRQAVSPKRNTQRRTFQQIFEQSRQQNIKLEGIINEKNINDATFDQYPALGDLFYVVFNDLCKDGGDQKLKMDQATQQFNNVIESIFPHYRLIADWNTTTGAPDIELRKHQVTRVPLEGLSLGEQEVLSLAIFIYTSRDRYDTFLIDEPEVHLNWHLEDRLFDFLDGFCDNYGKQMVVVTHSRIEFSRKFLPKTQFLYWNSNGRVSFGSDITAEQRRRIAGDAIEIIRLSDFSKPAFFVEDNAQALVVEKIAEVLGKSISVSECGSKSNVRSLFRHSMREGGWNNSFFIEDGDNEGNPYPGHDNFVHLEKYCTENYLLDTETIKNITNKSTVEIQRFLLEAVIEKKEQIFKKNKFFEFLIDHLSSEHMTDDKLGKLDASLILESFLRKIEKQLNSFMEEYILHIHREKKLNEIFPEKLITEINIADLGECIGQG